MAKKINHEETIGLQKQSNQYFTSFIDIQDDKEMATKLDAIISIKENGLLELDADLKGHSVNLSSVLAPHLMGIDNETALDSIMTLAGDIATDTTLDGLDGIRGAEIRSQFILTNALIIKSSEMVGIVGNVNNFIEINTPMGGTKYEVYTVSPYVIKGKGEIEDETPLNSTNIFTPISTLERSTSEVHDGAKVEYLFDVKLKSTDTENFKIRRGHTSVDITDFENDITLNFDDSRVASKSKADKDNREGANSKAVSYEVNYADGTVSIKLEAPDAISEGSVIFIESSLDSDDLVSSRSTIGVDIENAVYQPQLVNIGVEYSLVDEEEVAKSLNRSFLNDKLATVGNKIGSEILGKACRQIPKVAKEYAKIDLSGDTSLTKAEKFKTVLSKINQCSAHIATTTGIAGAGRTSLLGGDMLFDIYDLSSQSANGMTKAPTGEDNAISMLGLLNGRHKSYVYPNFDAENPIDEDGYSTIVVIGMPYEDAKAVFVKGMPIPLRPVKNLRIDDNLKIKIPFTGQLIARLNRENNSRKLAMKIKVKL